MVHGVDQGLRVRTVKTSWSDQRLAEMTWHFEPTMLHGRRYVRGESYEAGDPYATIVTVQILNGKTARISGMMNDGSRGDIKKADWLELRNILREQYGIVIIESERRGQDRRHDG